MKIPGWLAVTTADARCDSLVVGPSDIFMVLTLAPPSSLSDSDRGVRDDLEGDELRALLSGSGVVYVREDLLDEKI